MKKKSKIILCGIMTLIMAFVMAMPVSVSAADRTVSDASELTQAITEAENGDTITLGDNITQDITIPADKNITLNLNGKILTGKVVVEGGLTVKDNTVAGSPVVSNDYKTVTYESGKITNAGTTVLVMGGTFILESGKIESTGNLGVYVEGATTHEGNQIDATATINNGYIEAREFGVGVYGNKATANIEGGVIVGNDNAAVAGNGSNDNTKTYAGTEINVNGGMLIGHIITDGYIACGIYHPQDGILNVNGGTVYADNGVGILMRGGELNMTGGNVIATGTSSGKVGDSTTIQNCYGIQIDCESGYYDATNSKGVINGGNVQAADGVSTLSVVAGTQVPADGKMVVQNGAFSSDVSQYVEEGKIAIKYTSSNDEKTYHVGTPEQINDIVKNAAKVDKIEVLKGDIALSIPVGGVEVSNTGDGDVTVNDEAVTKGTPVVTTEPAQQPTIPSQPETAGETEAAGNSAKTGDDFNMTAVIALMGIAAATAAGTVVYGRRKRSN